MKMLFLFVFLTMLHPQSNTGNPFPAGCYMSFAEIQTKAPSVQCSLKIDKRETDAKVWLGGNDFRLTCADKCISNAKIRSTVWAYSNGSDLYINCMKLKKDSQPSFAQIITYGRYLAFYRNRLSDKVQDAMILGGVVGGAIATGASEKPVEQDLFVIDTKTAKLFWVDSNYMTKILKEKPELYNEFIHNGAKANDDAIQLQYIRLLNQAG